MIASLVQIWRHPIKSHGRERVEKVTLEAGRAMPSDRVWAVTHERSKFDYENPAWATTGQFSRGVSAPRLQQIEVVSDADLQSLSLSHPDLAPITIDPENASDAARFIAWITPITEGAKFKPAQLVRAPGRAMTDTDFPSISLINLASHRALGERLGRDLSPLRWRGNLLIDGLEPWSEFDLVGKTLRLGAAELEVVEPITRCRMTEANPETGLRDVETLATLRENYGHQDCGIYLRVISGGTIQDGDKLEVLT